MTAKYNTTHDFVARVDFADIINKTRAGVRDGVGARVCSAMRTVRKALYGKQVQEQEQEQRRERALGDTVSRTV